MKLSEISEGKIVDYLKSIIKMIKGPDLEKSWHQYIARVIALERENAILKQRLSPQSALPQSSLANDLIELSGDMKSSVGIFRSSKSDYDLKRRAAQIVDRIMDMERENETLKSGMLDGSEHRTSGPKTGQGFSQELERAERAIAAWPKLPIKQKASTKRARRPTVGRARRPTVGEEEIEHIHYSDEDEVPAVEPHAQFQPKPPDWWSAKSQEQEEGERRHREALENAAWSQPPLDIQQDSSEDSTDW